MGLSTGWTQSRPPAPADTARTHTVDIVDALNRAWPRLHLRPHDPDRLREGGHFLWIIPQVGYALPTGLLGQVLANLTFRRPSANLSAIVGSLIYTQHKQALFTLTSSIWLPDNRWVVMGDWRLMHYPQSTYGLGMYTSTDRVVSMDYAYLRLYQSALRRLLPGFYGGLGFQLDQHWTIRSWDRRHERTRISGYSYGIEGESTSAGLVGQFLYDNRPNAVNPVGGHLLNVVYRNNRQLLGSDTDFSSLLVDARTYRRLRSQSPNVLAIWAYAALTLTGNPPFLDLPSTGWDATGNLGRGFVQGRFRGKDLLYAEVEYRLQLTRNGLLGGVVFANAQSVSQLASRRFEQVAPAGGLGLRIRMNKATRANLCIDYAMGNDGSHGLYFNLGEVF
ncbi:BamA/TamA family outer membrane protein [Spirosoma luteolum]